MGGEGEKKARPAGSGAPAAGAMRGAVTHEVTGQAVRPEATTSIRPKAARPKLSVLVVDDEPRVLESLRLVLEGVHEVRTVGDAHRALAMVREDPQAFDVVLYDLTMAEVDAVAFYEEMQLLHMDRRFIVMTGGAYTARCCAFLEKRVCPVIDKPFLFEELLAVLDGVGGAAESAAL